MLTRIFLVLAIIAGLAVAVVNFVTVKEKIVTLQNNLKEQTAGRQKAEADASKTHKELDKTVVELKATKQNLVAATEEKDKAVKEAELQIKRADKLKIDLDKVAKDRDEALGNLAAYTGTGFNPPQILAFAKDIKGLNEALARVQETNILLGQKIVRLTNELALYKNTEYIVPLPSNLRGKVLVADPKWNFVVLNVGQNQGVLEHGELLVNRGGKLVAKVVIRSVQQDRSVANVLPGWQLGDIVEGDLVIPAHPSS